MKRYVIFFGIFFGFIAFLLITNEPEEKDPTPSIYATWDNEAPTLSLTGGRSNVVIKDESSNGEITVIIDRFYEDSFYYIDEGSVKNNYNHAVNFVKVKASFINKDKEVIDTNETYAVGNSGLESLESSKFKMYVDINKEIDTVQCEVYDYKIK